jgi:hypothetical protein
VNFLRCSRNRVKRAAGDSRRYRLPKKTPVDEAKVMKLQQAGENYMDAFSRRPIDAPTDE